MVKNKGKQEIKRSSKSKRAYVRRLKQAARHEGIEYKPVTS